MFNQNNNNCTYQKTEHGFQIEAFPQSDMVVDCQTGSITSNAAFLSNEVTGDFTISAKITHEFLSTYDAGCLIAYANDTLWAKTCFECTEANGHAVVTVMTNGTSDDANSVVLDQSSVWLQLCRKGSVVSVQYSTNGEDWIFVRILNIPLPDSVKLGILAQSPMGDGGNYLFEHIVIKNHAPENMRFGV